MRPLTQQKRFGQACQSGVQIRSGLAAWPHARNSACPFVTAIPRMEDCFSMFQAPERHSQVSASARDLPVLFTVSCRLCSETVDCLQNISELNSGERRCVPCFDPRLLRLPAMRTGTRSAPPALGRRWETCRTQEKHTKTGRTDQTQERGAAAAQSSRPRIHVSTSPASDNCWARLLAEGFHSNAVKVKLLVVRRGSDCAGRGGNPGATVTVQHEIAHCTHPTVQNPHLQSGHGRCPAVVGEDLRMFHHQTRLAEAFKRASAGI